MRTSRCCGGRGGAAVVPGGGYPSNVEGGSGAGAGLHTGTCTALVPAFLPIASHRYIPDFRPAHPISGTAWCLSSAAPRRPLT